MILLALVLLLLALSGCFPEVVEDFTQTCPQFFVNPEGILCPPTVFAGDNYKQICQVRYNNYEYATLYDTDNKIPVYSAYKFEGLMNCTRNNSWYIEPQLEHRNGSQRMEHESHNNINYNNQAVNGDYVYSGYDKGHLAPVYHARTQNCSDATFTLTNAAPQNLSFNRGQWKKNEESVAKNLKKKCHLNFTYIVTGVVPGNHTVNNRVNIPSHFWSAYCCLDNNLQVMDSRGFLGANNVNNQVLEMSVGDLDIRLTHLYNRGPFHVFRGKCITFPELKPIKRKIDLEEIDLKTEKRSEL